MLVLPAFLAHLQPPPRAVGGGICRTALLTTRIRGVRAPHPHSRRAECPALFSSLSTPQPGVAAAADAHLLRVINYVISCAQQDCKKRDWAKELGVGFPFQIQDEEGTGRITLTKRDQKEQIEVEVFLPSPVDPADQNGEQEGQAEDDNRQSQYCIPLTVKIHKGTLPEELQKAFYSYLKSRGISEDVTNFLHAYMINKECHGYLSWLRKLKSSIKS